MGPTATQTFRYWRRREETGT